jgi:hypothetical protein
LADNNLLAKSENNDFGDNSIVGDVKIPSFKPETLDDKTKEAEE